jgi:hypothetical protein
MEECNMSKEPNCYYSNDKFDPNDFSVFYQRLTKASFKQGYSITTLGMIKDLPLLLLTQSQPIQGPNILISSGFHGDEPAPCWAVLRVLEKSKTLLKRCNISFLPCVNPTGLQNNKRENSLGEDTNRGFFPDKGRSKSTEGNYLLQNKGTLKHLSEDAFMSMHESNKNTKFYISSIRSPNENCYDIEKLLVTNGSKYIEVMNNQIIKRDGQDILINGGITNTAVEDTFENYLSKSEVPYSFCTETPTKVDFYKRVWLNMELIKTLICWLS